MVHQLIMLSGRVIGMPLPRRQACRDVISDGQCSVCDFLIMTKSLHAPTTWRFEYKCHTDSKYGKRRSAIKKTVPIARN